jgi:hypothetical protein
MTVSSPLLVSIPSPILIVVAALLSPIGV